MINSVINMGNIIKNDNVAKKEYNIFVNYHNAYSYKYDTKTKTKKEKQEISSFRYIVVDIDNDSVSFDDRDSHPKIVKTIDFKLSTADKKSDYYLIGNIILKNKPTEEYLKNKLIYPPTFKQSNPTENEKKIRKLLDNNIPNTIIYKFRKTINNNIDIITDEILKVDTNNIAIIFEIKYNDSYYNFETIEIDEIYDILDDMYISNCKINNNYTFIDQLYNMFNYNKYNCINNKIMPDSSIPTYSKDDFISLLYAYKYYNKNTIAIRDFNLAIQILPQSEYLNFKDLNDLSEINPFDFNSICDKVNLFINQHQDNSLAISIPLDLKFDVYYRLKSDQNGYKNILSFYGIRYAKILELKDIINFAHNKVYDYNISSYYFYNNLPLLYQDKGSNDRYKSLIIDILKNIYLTDFTVPSQAEHCLINNMQYYIHNYDENDIRNFFNKVFKTFKFFKTMEDVNYIENLSMDKSFILGQKLAEYEAIWRNDRENLKKFSKNFKGSIKQKINSISNVIDYFTDITERLNRNNAYIHMETHMEISKIIKENISFNKNNFIFGYFDKVYSYNKIK